ncbi:hypothetical protein LG307_20455 [Sutcliffiella horikoshii]|uniref:hypothetical protein n=1 Tax=Sutcliffiella horikoshii TaxID=79883 RepID=UPI00384D54B7
MTIKQEILCPVCRQPFANNDLVKLDIVNTVYHVGCEVEFVAPSGAMDTFKEMLQKVWVFDEE